MRISFRQFKSFWVAEEVPRWMGLSLVALLLFGLGGMAHWMGHTSKLQYVEASRRAGDDTIVLLSSMLGGVDNTNAVAQQRMLEGFATIYDCEELRVVDATGLVLASIRVGEIGTVIRPKEIDPRDSVDVDEGDEGLDSAIHSTSAVMERRPVRVPIRSTTPLTGSGVAGSPRILEGVLRIPVVYVANTAAGTAAIALAVIVNFLVLYRLMRMHFRSMSRISETLMSRGDKIAEDLQSLRLADGESDLARQWNKLIDLVEELSTDARRANASVELKQVLEKSRRGDLADVVDIIPDGLLHVGSGTTLVYANAMARRVLNIPPDAPERIALTKVEAGVIGLRIIEHICDAACTDGSYRATTETVDDSDSDTTYRLRVLPLNKRTHRGEAVVTITDISQQVRADRAREEFVSQVTHELRTPLTNIRAYAETLSSGVFDDPQVITDCYNVITKETRRLARLIEDILSISQLEVGTMQLCVNNVDLGALLTDAVRDVRGLADEQKIDIQLSLPSKLPTLRGDRDKLAVVMNNLIGNALKYTPSGGSICVACQINAETVLLTVKDDGMGIDHADCERIFEKFQRGPSSDVGDIVGTGIGLTTAREIVRRHRGDIEVMSEKGKGATFIVRLPLSGVEPPSSSAPPTRDEGTATRSPTDPRGGYAHDTGDSRAETE